jgi:hypothetical protein
MIDKSISSALHKVKFSVENVVRGSMGEETKVLTATALMEIYDTLLLLAQQIAELKENK